MNKKKNAFSGMLGRLPIQEEINFARHLSIMIQAGLPIFEGLKIIQRQTTSKRLKRILDNVIFDVSNGHSLADSLGAQGNTFSDFFINVVHVGESSGTLASNLRYIADELKKAKSFRGKIRSALIYTAVIFGATLAIVSILVFYVFPQILPIFSSLNVELPITTRTLIAFSNFATNYWPWVIIGVVVLAVLIRVMLLVARIRYALHHLLLVVPVISKLTISMNVASFTRVMGVLLKSGIKIVEALIITSGTFNNLVYKKVLLDAAEELKKGEQLALPLARNKRVFPPLLSSMVEIGENTGNLQENLFYLADYYTEELDNDVRNMTTLLEPLLLLVMGLMVGFIALSIITPIYQISSNLQT